MKIKEKKQLLIKLIELSLHLGEDISGMVGKPLNCFDWEKVKQLIAKKTFYKQSLEELDRV